MIHRISRVVVAATLAFSFGTIAKAADWKAPASVYNWTGFYAGGQVGYGSGRASGSWEGLGGTFSGPLVPYEMPGVIGGVQAGYNWQSGGFVLGGEVDVAFGSMPGGAVQFTGIATVTANQRIDALASARVRAGALINDTTLLYATAGLGAGNSQLTVTSVGGLNTTARNSQTHVGWTVGVGGEMALHDNWTVGAEYKYFDLGSKLYSDPANVDGSATIALKVHTVVVKANYRF
jgi:outer membrane autotransporter protein